MRQPPPPTSTRIRLGVSRVTLCCALAASAAAAQAGDPMALPATADLYDQDTMGTMVTPGRGARSVFLGTIAALLAQGVGTALSQGLAGSITKWFNRPQGTSAGMGQATPRPAASEGPVTGQMRVGLAYEVHLIGGDGTTRAVDPGRHVFHTGERFQIHYRPTLPGRIKVDNVNPQGVESRIDNVEVAAGQLASLGPYQFVGAKGLEMLKLTLEPCSSPMLAAATRGIVNAGPSSTGRDPALRLGACDAATARSGQAKTRTIKKTTLEGPTAFALDQLDHDELTSGPLAAREVRISLQHR